MLSRRDKLLIRPWEERRYKDHRAKVQSALPAIDASAPSDRPHVAHKLKKRRSEQDRAERIQRDNFTLLQRLTAIMRVNRLDNHWIKPLPNFQNKVGVFFDADSLRSRVSARSSPSVLPPPPPPPGPGGDEAGPARRGRCVACYRAKELEDDISEAPRICLPSLRL